MDHDGDGPPPSLTEPLLPTEGGTSVGNESVAANDAEERAEIGGRAEEAGSGGGPAAAAPGGGSKSRNIPLTLAYTALAYAGRSLWSQSVLPAFVFLLRRGDPEWVGFVTAVMGVFTLLASFPAGAVADRHRRDAVLRAASAAGVLAIAATCAASYAERFDLLGAALAAWGLYWGLSDAPLGALFADSVRDGDRSRRFTQRYILVKAGSLAGPASALVMFAALGNSWTVRDCAAVMAAGQALSLPAVLMLCFFSDDYAVPHGEEGNGGERGGGGEEIPPRRVPSRSVLSSRSSSAGTQATALESSSSSSECDSGIDVCLGNDGPADDREDEGAPPEGLRSSRFCFCAPRRRKIPVLVATADFTAGLAAGMSIRYFPIFFMDNLKLSPISVQVLYALSPMGQAFLSKMAQLASKRLGRPQTTVLFKWTGIVLMICMILGYTYRLPVPLVCAIFLVRDSFMNSTQALNKSLLMDTVPREERGKWSALESVNMFSWSGSAAVGGILVGKMGLIFNFYVTALLQFAATLPLVALFREVPIEAAAAATTTVTATTGGVTLSENEEVDPVGTSPGRHRRRERRKVSGSDEELAGPLLRRGGQCN